jgi:Tfp pilus assembly protein PilW
MKTSNDQSTTTPGAPRFGTPRNARTAGRRGLSIVEVMISLTICSFLLVAVAAAYNASASAVEMNDRFFRATQAGRVTMNQLLTEIRRADWVACAPTSDSVIVTRPAVNRMPEEDSREYRYDAAAKKITLQIFYKKADGTTYTGPKYSLSSNVEWAKFGPADKIKDATGADQDIRIPVTVEVKIGGNQVRLSGSSGPRRMLQN